MIIRPLPWWGLLLTAVFCGVYPALFFVSNNIESMNVLSIVVAVAVFAGLGVLLALLLRATGWLFLRHRMSWWCAWETGVLLAFLAWLMRHPVFGVPSIYEWLVFRPGLTEIPGLWIAYAILVVPAFLLGAFVLCRKPWGLLFLTAALTVFNAIEVSRKFQMPVVDRVDNSDELIDQVRIDDKKNVVFILMDSWASIEAMELLGIDDSAWYQELQSAGFTLYPSFFTGAQPTVFAMPSFMQMDMLYQGRNLYWASKDVRTKMMAGQGKVYDIFRSNGYDNRIIHLFNYLTGWECEESVCFPELPMWQKKLDGFLQIADRVLLENRYNWAFNPALTSASEWEVFKDYSLQSLLTLNSSRPSFTYIHDTALPGHANVSQPTCDLDAEVSAYQGRLLHAKAYLREALQNIQRADPDALVIIAADHGPFLARSCSADTEHRYREHLLERQGAFLAIRWGKEYDGRYDTAIRSSQNLFRYVISHLSGDEFLLQQRKPDSAWSSRDRQTIDDGHYLLPPAPDGVDPLK